ncbi:hypothetical protein D3C84_378020 [compost metagenome]
MIEVLKLPLIESDTDFFQGTEWHIGEVQPGSEHIQLADRHAELRLVPSSFAQACSYPSMQHTHLQGMDVTLRPLDQTSGA